MKTILKKSISELEGWQWTGDIPTEDGWRTEFRFYQLHRRPIADLQISDIYFLILENTGLEYLVPIALEKLADDLLLEAENYPGDLFSALLSINNSPSYWSNHKPEKRALMNIYERQKDRLNVGDFIEYSIIKRIKHDYKTFVEVER